VGISNSVLTVSEIATGLKPLAMTNHTGEFMTEGIIGKKLGMTQVFGEGGKAEAITAIEAGPCTIMQVKIFTGI